MRTTAVLALALCLAPASALATTITFNVTGTIGKVSDPSGVLTGEIAVGMPFTGSFTYTTGLPDENADPTIGRFTADPVGSGFSTYMIVGGHVVESTPAAGVIANVRHPGPIGDLIQLSFDAGASTLGLPILNTEVFLQSTSSSVLSSDALPNDLDRADWDGDTAPDYDDSATINFAVGPITSLAIVFGEIETITRVPEPATGLLFGLGLASALCARRRPLTGEIAVGMPFTRWFTHATGLPDENTDPTNGRIARSANASRS